LFNYDDPTNPDQSYNGGLHTYRPDLVPLILDWIAKCPPVCWQNFVCFRTGCRGEFVAKFAMSPDRGGPERVVEVMIDHRYTEIVTDTREWIFDHPTNLKPETLRNAVNRF
jgi:hypothetical protein